MLSEFTKCCMCFFITTTSLSVASGHSRDLTISPRDTEYVRYVNETHHVLCLTPHSGVGTAWTGPSGVKVPPTKGRIHTEERSGKVKGVALFFESIEKKDKGNYTCSALVDGKEAKVHFKLIVIKPISFLDTPTVQNASEHSQTLVRCEVEGEPMPTVVWHVKGAKLNGSSAKYNIVADGLIIKNVSIQDRGEYQCRAFQMSPVISNMVDQKIMLNIQHKPTWKRGDRAVEAYGYMSGVVNLTCEASADPPATYQWYKGNQSIVPRINVTIIKEKERSTLQLIVHNKSVFSNYTCQAKNLLGSSQRVFKLREGEKPAMPTHVSIIQTNVESVELDIKSPTDKQDIVGYSVQYMKKHRDQDKKWELGTTYELVKGGAYNVTGLEHDTSYLLRVASRNKAGVSDYSPAVSFRTLQHSNAATVTASRAAAPRPPGRLAQTLSAVMLVAAAAAAHCL